MSSPSNPFDPERRTEPLQADEVFHPGGPERDLRAEPLIDDDPPWTGWDVLRMVVVAVVAIFFSSLVAFEIARQIVPGSKTADLGRNPLVVVPAQAAAYLVLLGFMYALMTHSYHRGFWRGVHWHFPAARWIFFVFGGVVLAVVVEAASNFLPIPKSLPIDEYFRNPQSAWLMAGFGTLLAPLVEELLFRGFLYPVMRRRVGVVVGTAVTAILFALIHESQLAHAWAPLLMLFCVGVALTLTRELTDSVAASTLVHMGYNATLFSMVWIATDHFRHLEKISQ
jgi:membrane protease YdiL (CAAX protease family)